MRRSIGIYLTLRERYVLLTLSVSISFGHPGRGDQSLQSARRGPRTSADTLLLQHLLQGRLLSLPRFQAATTANSTNRECVFVSILAFIAVPSSLGATAALTRGT